MELSQRTNILLFSLTIFLTHVAEFAENEELLRLLGYVQLYEMYTLMLCLCKKRVTG